MFFSKSDQRFDWLDFFLLWLFLHQTQVNRTLGLIWTLQNLEPCRPRMTQNPRRAWTLTVGSGSSPELQNLELRLCWVDSERPDLKQGKVLLCFFSRTTWTHLIWTQNQPGNRFSFVWSTGSPQSVWNQDPDRTGDKTGLKECSQSFYHPDHKPADPNVSQPQECNLWWTRTFSDPVTWDRGHHQVDIDPTCSCSGPDSAELWSPVFRTLKELWRWCFGPTGLSVDHMTLSHWGGRVGTPDVSEPCPGPGREEDRTELRSDTISPKNKLWIWDSCSAFWVNGCFCFFQRQLLPETCRVWHRTRGEARRGTCTGSVQSRLFEVLFQKTSETKDLWTRLFWFSKNNKMD